MDKKLPKKKTLSKTENNNSTGKKEIKVKENPKAAALKRAPDEVLAMAIHDTLLKDKTSSLKK